MSVLRSLSVVAQLAIFSLSTAACDKGADSGGAGTKAASSPQQPTEEGKAAVVKAKVTAKAKTPKVADLAVVELPGLQKHIKDSGAKLTVVAMWATWCGPCIEEMGHLDTFYKAHRGQGVEVVGLCTDDQGHMGSKIQKVLDKTAVSYGQLLLNPGGEDAMMKGIGESWDGMLPKTFVLDATGAKVAFFAQAVDEKVLAEKVLPLLEGK